MKSQLENTDTLIVAHELCTGVCSLHNRTNHHMRSWPQNYRYDVGMMERICEHGIGHYDPDDYKIVHSIEAGWHSCDGCCVDNRT